MGETTAGPTRCDVIVRNGTLITMDAARRIYAPGALAVSGRTIAAVGPEAEVLARYQASQVIDAGGAPVHPGFIDAHVHVVHGTCRGIFGDMASAAPKGVTFADWKADVSPEDEHAAAKLAGLEMLRNGFTCFIEPGTVFDGDAVAEAAQAVGLRGLLAGPYLWDQVEVMKHLGGLESRSLYERAPPDTERCLAQLGRELHRNRADGLVRGYVALYGLGTASDALLAAAKAMAEAHGVAFHQHEGYTPEASQADAARLGRSRIAHLAELGVLGENATLIHMNVVSDDDMRTLLETGTSVVWCPLAYLRLGLARRVDCRIPSLLRAGLNVALGIDGALDSVMGDTGPAAFLVGSSGDTPVTPGDILEMQTINAARVAGLAAQIGSLEAGKRADIVLRAADAAEGYPGVNPVHQLALTSRGGTVDTVFVDGREVLRRGRSPLLDEPQVLAEAKASVQQRLARLGLQPDIGWPVVG